MARSYLFIPGNHPAMIQNADVFGADALIFDLEDAGAAHEKDAARLLLAGYLSQAHPQGIRIYVRINGLDTAWACPDLEAVVGDAVDGIVLPKAGLSEVMDLTTILHNLEAQKGLEKKVAILPIVETAKSLVEVEEIAKLSRLDGILLGAEDLSADMEFDRTKSGIEIQYPRARIAFACKAARIEAVDTPFTDTNDPEGLREDCLRAQSLGMSAKAAIHPNQTETIHEVFSPSSRRIEWAMRIRAAARKAAEQHRGVFSLDGKMVDTPIIDRAEKILAAAERFGLLPEDRA